MRLIMRIKTFVIAFFLIISIGKVAGETSSRNIISVNADYAERSEKTGYTMYRGNVEISQGNLLIKADQIQIFYAEGSAKSIVCEGLPSTLEYEASDQTLIKAEANNLAYSVDKNIVDLKNNATLQNNGTVIRGDSITYDLTLDTWQAKGGDKDEQNRIQLLIPAIQTPEL